MYNYIKVQSPYNWGIVVHSLKRDQHILNLNMIVYFLNLH